MGQNHNQHQNRNITLKKGHLGFVPNDYEAALIRTSNSWGSRWDPSLWQKEQLSELQSKDDAVSKNPHQKALLGKTCIYWGISQSPFGLSHFQAQAPGIAAHGKREGIRRVIELVPLVLSTDHSMREPRRGRRPRRRACVQCAWGLTIDRQEKESIRDTSPVGQATNVNIKAGSLKRLVTLHLLVMISTCLVSKSHMSLQIYDKSKFLLWNFLFWDGVGPRAGIFYSSMRQLYQPGYYGLFCSSKKLISF